MVLKDIPSEKYLLADLKLNPSLLDKYEGSEWIYRIYDSEGRSYIGYSAGVKFRFNNKLFGYLHPKPNKSRICKMLYVKGLDKFWVEFYPYSDDHDELYYITKYDSYVNGYNTNPNGIGGFTRKKYIVSRNNEVRTIPYKELKSYLSTGWIINK